MALAKVSKANELLDGSKKSHNMLKLAKTPGNDHSSRKSSKPLISKPEIQSSNIRSRLNSFLPDLKAANEALPEDRSSLNIEKLDDADQYIEMDLGLGVLEEKHEDDDSSSSSGDDEEDEHGDVLSRLMKKQVSKPGMIEVIHDQAPPDSRLLCDPALQRFRSQCLQGAQFEMDIVLSLMSRILIQLRNHKGSADVQTITKLNVLREDMYKLMSRRDRLIDSDEGRLKHESLYLEELDQLVK
ncbi:protein of unknown function [Taphrina deformans PYCC 5710]|uniref:Uncharacterized protein n=1 Tax=Taphrina deformans (strain PYCC 5710 / ATCC 11124 / CBS 356.35 / IMI 108563 / JCM 9778 / NBRC 8474) TaxID=1097556 RepID=R4XFK3_TAPDE|nr:protein of unknown function [Taphrina deformans PYCC 5710]|eukprot:CCG83262.1 protein of unknown function [Taphrina deformans PYCC 5710]